MHSEIRLNSFSVLLSVYFKESPQNLDECLSSIFSQTMPPDEVVLVLDGHIGEPLRLIIDKWEALLPLVVHPLDKNVGLGKALNIGLSMCSNEIIFRMDTDDICVPERFEKQINRFHSNPELSIIGGYIDEYDEGMVALKGTREVPLKNNDIIKYMRYRNPFNHMTVAFRKSAITDVGGYQHHEYMEDYNLWLRLLSRGYLGENLPEVLVHARTGNSMISRRRGWSYIKSEWHLAKLKKQLKLQTVAKSMYILLLRTVPRVLPISMTKIIYALTRK